MTEAARAGTTETEYELARAILSLADVAGMPDSYWTTDSRTRSELLALTTKNEGNRMSQQRGPRAEAVMERMLGDVLDLSSARRQAAAERAIEGTLTYQLAALADAVGALGAAYVCAFVGHRIPATAVGVIGWDSHRRCGRCRQLVARRHWPAHVQARDSWRGTP